MLHSIAKSSEPWGLLAAGLLWSGFGLALVGLWIQPAGLALSGLSGALSLLTLFVAAVVASFSLRYMRADQAAPLFFLQLVMLVAAVLVFLLSPHMLVLAAAWCASGWLLARLIGHSRHWAEARAAARRAHRSFLIGDAALLAALALLAWQTATLDIHAALAQASTLSAPMLSVIGLLLVIAAAARCALPPFANWLLSSMTAPTPVSALMHAGLVNAGGFLLLRFAPLMEAAPLARILALLLGVGAALYGIGIMMVRPDVKRALAGSTVSQMGFMIMSCALGAYGAALWHIVAHGLFKAWLFLGSGGAIGRKGGKSRAPVSLWAQGAIALIIGCIALLFILNGQHDARLVPLLLALATAGATLVAALNTALPLRAKLGMLLLVLLLIAVHGAGLAWAQRAIGADAAPLVPAWVMLVLLLIFLSLWLWQQRRMPLRLYVHFINAGALPPASKGDVQ